MSDLLTTLTVTAVAPFVFQTDMGANHTDKLFWTSNPQIVAVQKLEPKELSSTKFVNEVSKQETPKREKKEEPKKETPTPKVVTYTVEEGDNLSVIADKHQTSWVRIWQSNKQLEHQDQLKVGDKLTIPNEDEQLEERSPVTTPVAPVSDSSTEVAQVTTSTSTTSYTASQSVSRPYVGEPNAYAVGWCTWWVKEKRPEIGGYWGNAGYNWISAAQAAGFSTGSTPVAGAIGVQAGHVVYVESVSGSQVNISEMGWGYRANTVPNYRTVSASEFTYIY